jgi:uncharacterized protein with HEPN domain
MTRRNPIYLAQDVIEIATNAIAFSAGRRREDLDTDIVFQYAATRAIELVGEAIRQLQPLIGRRYPHVEWRKIIGMRNRLVHAYADTNLDVIWEALDEDLPELVKQFESIERDLLADTHD